MSRWALFYGWLFVVSLAATVALRHGWSITAVCAMVAYRLWADEVGEPG